MASGEKQSQEGTPGEGSSSKGKQGSGAGDTADRRVMSLSSLHLQERPGAAASTACVCNLEPGGAETRGTAGWPR